MTQRTVSHRASYDVPAEILWGVVSDHEGMSRWVPAEVEVMRGDGGVGTVRRVRTFGLDLEERVLWFDPPRRMLYRLTGGLPLRYHQGELRVRPLDAGVSELCWDITVSSGVPGLAVALCAILGLVMRRALGDLRGVLQEG